MLGPYIKSRGIRGTEMSANAALITMETYVQLDDSAFLRTQSYITEICYFEFLWSFEFWLAPHWDFFSKDPPIYWDTYKVDQNQN